MVVTILGAALAVVGGTETAGGHPEVLATKHSGGICTATLVHPRWALTAAHCWDAVDLAAVAEIPGRANPSDVWIGTGGGVGIDAVYIHPEYVSFGFSPNSVADDVAPVHDLALLHLSEPLPGTPVQLNEAPLDDSWLGVRATFVGYGITQFNGSGSGTKREVELAIVEVDDSVLEAFHPDGALCQGDSGGPGLLEVNGRWVQLSAASFGRDRQCIVGVNTRIDRYIDWIRSVMGSDPLETVAVVPPPPEPMDWDTASDTGSTSPPVVTAAASRCDSAATPGGALGALALLGLSALRRRGRCYNRRTRRSGSPR